MRRALSQVVGLLATVGLVGCVPGARPTEEFVATTRSAVEQSDVRWHLISRNAEAVLMSELTNLYPRALDVKFGGFHSVFNRDYSKGDSPYLASVFQARMTWTAAEVVIRRPKFKDEYLAYTRHGADVLMSRLWDKEQGGFHWAVMRDAGVVPHEPWADVNADKHTYGQAFAIYALANAYRATGDVRDLTAAQNAFLWLDSKAHDPDNGGYFEQLKRDGTPIKTKDESSLKCDTDQIGTPWGLKSSNTHVHLLEAFTALHDVWPDSRVKARLEELVVIVRDRMTPPSGAMHLTFNFYFSPVSNQTSHGHNVETAFLLLDAVRSLGRPDDQVTWTIARSMVDNTLKLGFDRGVLGNGPCDAKAPTEQVRNWWASAESANALLLMHERYGIETHVYRAAFDLEFKLITDHFTDCQFGGWYEDLNPNLTPSDKKPLKHQDWKAAYHTSRSMLNIADRAKRLAGL